MLCNIPPCDIYSSYTAWHRETFINGDGVRNSVSGIEDYACCAAGGVEGEQGWEGGLEGGYVYGCEEDLGGCVPVGSGVEGGFC